MKRSGEFERHLVRKLLGFALGRQLNKFDDCVINDCMEKLNSNEHRSRLVIETIATSYSVPASIFHGIQREVT